MGNQAAKTDIEIIIDTREIRPWGFDNCIRKKLNIGDYSVSGYEDRIAIERKSLDDWINTILRQRERFARELARLNSFDFAAVVIESTPREILSGQYKSEINGQALLSLTSELIIRFRPVHVIFGGDRPSGRVLAESLLRFAVKHCNEVDKLNANLSDLNNLQNLEAVTV